MILIIFYLILPFVLPYIVIILYAGKYTRQLKDENEAIYDDAEEMVFMH